MKSKRHNQILDIINNNDIETQEELADALKIEGYDVTQATVSRDIKLLKEERDINDKLYSILKNAAISVEQVDKFVVVKTLTGAASAAAEAIDSLYTNDVAGTIAGDNTIFVLVRSDEKAVELISKIRKMIS